MGILEFSEIFFNLSVSLMALLVASAAIMVLVQTARAARAARKFVTSLKLLTRIFHGKNS